MTGASEPRPSGAIWDKENPWNGWWGDNPPFHPPVLVVTHHARPPLALDGGTTNYFVTEGLESALDRAKAAAGELGISLGWRRQCGAAMPVYRTHGRHGPRRALADALPSSACTHMQAPPTPACY
jgi:hypothetical protein